MAKLGGIVVSRMDSQRLPGKTLREVRGKPLLWYVLARCRAFFAPGHQLIVATTDRSVDDPIAWFCGEHGFQCYRGATDDVSGRLLGAATEFGIDWFFRLNGDSPYVDPALLAEAWRIARGGEYDFVTNLAPRSFPYGISVELIRTGAYAIARRGMIEPRHMEHATLFLYEHLHYFRYYNMLLEGEDLSGVRLTVDTEEDYAFFVRAVNALGSRWPHFSFRKAVELYGARRADPRPVA
jgi:spore coat polysaccharide biosynthesis protein SpsF